MTYCVEQPLDTNSLKIGKEYLKKQTSISVRPKTNALVLRRYEKKILF